MIRLYTGRVNTSIQSTTVVVVKYNSLDNPIIGMTVIFFASQMLILTASGFQIRLNVRLLFELTPTKTECF